MIPPRGALDAPNFTFTATCLPLAARRNKEQSLHYTYRPAMTESTRRRRRYPRAPSAVLAAAALACSSSRSHAFVPPSSTFSVRLSSSAALALAPTRAPSPARQHRHQQKRRLSQAGGGGSPRNSRFSSSTLAGALPADGAVVTDHTDGWNPIHGVEVGTCSLVGSGPGDPDLLTVAGLRELQSADLVIADRLVSKEILGLVSYLI